MHVSPAVISRLPWAAFHFFGRVPPPLVTLAPQMRDQIVRGFGEAGVRRRDGVPVGGGEFEHVAPPAIVAFMLGLVFKFARAVDV